MTAGVYQVLNKVTEDKYIDGSCYIEQMIESIVKTLSLPDRVNPCHPIFCVESKLSQDWIKYGRENFSLSMIEKTAKTKEVITPKRIYWCRLLQPRYNLYYYDPIVSGVYQVVCTKDNSSYIGQSKDIYQRWKQHKYQLSYNRHSNKGLQLSFNHWGLTNFELRILEVCVPEEKTLLNLEKVWINRSTQLFNIRI